MVGAKGERVKGIHLPRARGEDECYRESPHPHYTSYGAEKLSRPRPSRGGEFPTLKDPYHIPTLTIKEKQPYKPSRLLHTKMGARADLCLNDKPKPVDWRIIEATTSRQSYTSVSSFYCRNMCLKSIKIFAERQRRSRYRKYHFRPISHASKTQIGKKASDKIKRLTNGEILNVSSPNK